MTLEEIKNRIKYLDDIFSDIGRCGYTDDEIEAQQVEIAEEWLKLNEMKKNLESQIKQ
jgi:hypothetical protein